MGGQLRPFWQYAIWCCTVVLILFLIGKKRWVELNTREINLRDHAITWETGSPSGVKQTTVQQSMKWIIFMKFLQMTFEANQRWCKLTDCVVIKFVLDIRLICVSITCSLKKCYLTVDQFLHSSNCLSSHVMTSGPFTGWKFEKKISNLTEDVRVAYTMYNFVYLDEISSDMSVF